MSVESPTGASLISHPSVFITRDGLQFVRPYEYVFQVAVKGRWVGRTAVDVFRTEFPHYGPEYYDAAIDGGRITVQWEAHRKKGLEVGADAAASGPLDPRQPLRLGHVLFHRLHRHELPVLAHAAPVCIVDYVPLDSVALVRPTGTTIGTDSRSPALRGVFAFDKPPSVPVHPSGRYQRNTIQEFVLAGDVVVSTERAARAILGQAAAHGYTDASKLPDPVTATALMEQATAVVKEAMAWGTVPEPEGKQQARATQGPVGLHTCHRLDKGTSGVLLVATGGDVARGMSDALSDKSDEAAHVANGPSKTAKTYLALVSGRVPRISDDTDATGATEYAEPGEQLIIRRAIYCKSARDGIFDCLTAAQERLRVSKCKVNSTAAGIDTKEVSGSAGPADDRLRRQREDTATAKERLKEKHARQVAATTRDKRGAATAAAAAASTTAAEPERHSEVDSPTTGTATTDAVLVECAKWAATRVTVLMYDAARNETLVECEPYTGRTHQLRVHLARVLRCPIVGDDSYGWECSGASSGSSVAEHRASHIRRFLSKAGAVVCDAAAVAGGSLGLGGLVPNKDYAAVPSCVECRLALQNQTAHMEVPPLPSKEPAPEDSEVQVKCSDDRLVMEGSSLLCLHALRYQLDLGACGLRVSGSAATTMSVETPRPLWAAVEPALNEK